MEQTNGNLALMPRVQPTLAEWTAEQKRVVKNIVCPGINDDELIVFAATCARTGLDPFSSPPQIYAYVRNQKVGDKWERRLVVVSGINGFRSIGESTGEYIGMDGPYWCGEDGVWKEVWLSPKPPVAAKVGILRKGFAQPVWGIATYKSFYQEKNANWNKMPDRMLAVTAEREGWAKTFPRKCGGMYIPEEMSGDDQVVEGQVVAQEPRPPAKEPEPTFLPPAGKSWQVWCGDLAKETGVFDDKSQYLEFLSSVAGKPIMQKYTDADWAKVARKLQEMLWAMREESSDDAGDSQTVEADQAETEAVDG